MERNFTTKAVCRAWLGIILSSRRWSRRLTLFYKIVNNLAPDYTMDPIPQLHQSRYSLRKQDVVGRIMARTANSNLAFILTVYVNGTILNQNLDLHHRSLSFKKKILSIIRPHANPVFGIHDPIGLSSLTQLRVGLSKLNCHKFKHNFRDAVNPMCPVNPMRNTSCCFALLLMLNDEIFSLESMMYYDLLDIVIFQIRS